MLECLTIQRLSNHISENSLRRNAFQLKNVILDKIGYKMKFGRNTCRDDKHYSYLSVSTRQPLTLLISRDHEHYSYLSVSTRQPLTLRGIPFVIRFMRYLNDEAITTSLKHEVGSNIKAFESHFYGSSIPPKILSHCSGPLQLTCRYWVRRLDQTIA